MRYMQASVKWANRTVSPSARRREGFLDARNGKPAMSLDPHYLMGFRAGERAKSACEDADEMNVHAQHG